MSASLDLTLREQGFSRLVDAYWKPIYAYLRLRHNLSRENAQDFVQGFFATTWEKNSFSKYDSEKGKFRTFVRVCVDRFVINQYESRTRLKRGGANRVENIDFDSLEGSLQIVDADQIDPELLFEREWVRNLLVDVISKLQIEYAEAGKELAFAVFEAYDLGDPIGSGISYQLLSDRFGLTTATITNYLHMARRDLRNHIINRLREVAPTNQELRDDVRIMLGLHSKNDFNG